MFEQRVGARYPIVWGKDGACLKRLLAQYPPEEIERLQDAYFAQAADSFAGRQGYTVTEFLREAPALLVRIKAEEGLTDEQRSLVADLQAEGVQRDTALALVREHSPEEIRRQVRAHAERKPSLRAPASALVKAIHEGWAVPEKPASAPSSLPELPAPANADGTRLTWRDLENRRLQPPADPDVLGSFTSEAYRPAALFRQLCTEMGVAIPGSTGPHMTEGGPADG